MVSQGVGRRIERLAWLLAGLGAVLSLYLLPVEAAVLRLEAQVETLGPWGWVAYGLAYAILSLLFVPASALGVGAGAVFGGVLGGMAVFGGGILAASVGFWVGRVLGRARLERLFEGRQAWRVVDQAVGRDGAKVVALVRLLPVIPFSASNYAFGVTGIPFRVYLPVSAVALLPGMFTYVALGALGRFRLGSLFDERLGLLLLLGGGLVLLVLRTLVRWALRTLDAAGSGLFKPSARTPRPGRAVAWAFCSAVVWAGAYQNREALAGILGPPPVHGVERHPAEGEAFDHQELDRLLGRYVDAGGAVDYVGLRAEGEVLRRYLDRVAFADFERLSRDEKLAFLINAYNANTLRLIIEHWPIASILEIPADRRWRGRRFSIGRREVSLEQLEHRWIRAEFAEPRVHFALVCASKSCPPLLPRAYRGSDLELTLAEVTRRAHADPNFVALSADRRELWLTPLYDWYRTDLTIGAGALLPAVASRAPLVAEALSAGAQPRIRWRTWDWTLNVRSPPRSAPPTPLVPAPAADAPPAAPP